MRLVILTETTTKLLASKGAKVVLGARHEDRLKRIADEIVFGRFDDGHRIGNDLAAAGNDISPLIVVQGPFRLLIGVLSIA